MLSVGKNAEQQEVSFPVAQESNLETTSTVEEAPPSTSTTLPPSTSIPWQKPTQYCKAIIIQFKLEKFFKYFHA